MQAEDGTSAGDAAQGQEIGFRPPRRRRKPLVVVTVLVFAVVGYLVFLMAKGPGVAEIAEGLVERTLDALPEGWLAAADVESAANGIQQALEAHPGNNRATTATALLQQRIATQVETDLLTSELDKAQDVLAAAGASWPGEEQFGETGDLQLRLDEALQARALGEEVAHLISTAQDRLTRGPENGQAIADALQQLRLALDLEPDNARARELREEIRRDVATAARNALDAGNPQRAHGLLEAVEGANDDPQMARLRTEVRQRIAELERAVEIRRLLDSGQWSLAADRLSVPAGANAVDYFRQVLELDAENEPAKKGLGRVADRYASLVRRALSDDAPREASRFLANLAEVEPEHPELHALQAEVEAMEQARDANSVVSGTTDASSPSDQTADPPWHTLDDEGRLWSSVKDGCNETDLRRYVDTYPAGRFVEQAWVKISACLSQSP